MMQDKETTDLLESRIEELETKLMFQEELVDQLNHSLILQQKDINKLISLIEKLNAQVDSLQEPNVIDANLETPPPHY
ncbi:SlyX family protein [Aliikangiella sp. G2MR2-5]|uniref:SlyX family protein n=1 Tax=Aliikangiella sp. G2MR2-5 TaxID=2788943 RepID=UPI001AED5E41|nr:SlyX family protein [Aliikangiella sp. G2MR2-5]